MAEIRKSCAVAFARERNNATDAERATNAATAKPITSGNAMIIMELRAQLRAQLARNQDATQESANPPELRTPQLPIDARRQRVLAMLDKHPDTLYAVLTDAEADPDVVLLILAIRGRASCDLRIPRDKYDPFLLLDLIERHGGTVP